MTAWKIWPLPQSGTPRARVTAPLWPKTERSWVELSTLRLMGERTQHCRPWFFPAARFTPAVPTIGQMSESARRQSPPTCRLTGHFAVSEHHCQRERFAIENQSRTMKKGIGVAAFLHGAGFTGSGERYLSSVVGVEGCADGSVRVLVSSTEFGQGTKTVLSQIAAETLGLGYEDVDVAPADTMEVPNSGPTVASRTVMVVGKLVHSAAFGIKQTLKQCGLLGDSYSPEEFRAACRNYRASHGEFRSWARYEAPPGIFWDDQKYCGEAYAAFAWAVYIAAVTVDRKSTRLNSSHVAISYAVFC